MQLSTKMVLAVGATCCLSMFVQTAHAAPVQWRVQDGGNGHWYEFLPDPNPLPHVGWPDFWYGAKADAQAMTHNGFPGDLATITSPEECQFIAEQGWSGLAWLGAYQEPEGFPLDEDWHWISQWKGTAWEQAPEAWGYTNWRAGEPNFSWEDGLSTWPSVCDWNDADRDGTNAGDLNAIVEYLPEPTTLSLLTLGGLAVARRAR